MSEVDPGDGYRLLKIGEVIQAGDEYHWVYEWHSANKSIGEKVTGSNYDAWRRRIVHPIPATTSGPHVAIEVHRAALAEIERLKAELEAVKQPQPELEPEWFDLTPFDGHVLRRDVDWVVYTYSEKWQIVGISRGAKIGQVRGYIAKARCLLKDAPPKLVAKANADKCIHTFDCNAGDHSDACPAAVLPKTETVTFHEVVIRDRYQMQLCWVAELDQFHIPTGRTETREVVR